MKLNKLKLFFFSILSLFLPQAAYAAKEAPAPGPERIPWAIECCGKIPKYMLVGLLLLALSILITLIMNIGKGDSNEK